MIYETSNAKLILPVTADDATLLAMLKKQQTSPSHRFARSVGVAEHGQTPVGVGRSLRPRDLRAIYGDVIALLYPHQVIW